MILCDTNVIIEILKGNKRTINIIESIGLENIAISSVTVMELYFGALNKRELNKIKKHLQALNIVHFDTDISESAIKLIIHNSSFDTLNSGHKYLHIRHK